MSERSATHRQHWLRGPAAGAIASAVVALVLFGPSFTFDFVYDDHGVVKTDERLSEPSFGFELWVAQWWVEGAAEPVSRPLTTFTFWTQVQLHGRQPAVYHLVNAVLWALLSAMVALLAGRWTERWWSVWVVGLLFAAHPIHVEVAANVVGRAEILAALFSVIALRLWLSWRERLTWRRVAALGVLILAAGLSKEHGYLTAALLAAMELGLRVRHGESMRGRTWVRYWPVGLAIVVVAMLAVGQRIALYQNVETGKTAEIDNPLHWSPTSERVVTPLKIIGKAAQLLAAPVVQSPDYSPRILMPTHRFDDPLVLAGLAVVGGWIVGVVYAWRRRSPALGPLLCLVVVWFVPSNTLALIGTIFGERLLTMTSMMAPLALVALAPERIGRHPFVLGAGMVCVALLLGFVAFVWITWEPMMILDGAEENVGYKVLAGWDWRQILLGLVCVAGCGLWLAIQRGGAAAVLLGLAVFSAGWATNFYSLVWRHGDALMVYTVTTHPEGGRFMGFQSMQLARMAMYKSEIADDPELQTTYMDLAEQHALVALEQWPRQDRPYAALGMVAEHRGDYEAAREYYRLSGRGQRKWSAGDYGLARLGELDELETLKARAEALSAELDERPEDHAARRQLAQVYLQLREFEEAAIEYKRVVDAGVVDARLLNLYAEALMENGQFSEAMEVYLLWLKLEPNNWVPLTDASFIAIGMMAHLEKVEGWLRRAMAISPGSAEPWVALGQLYRLNDRPDDAMLAYREALRRSDPSEPKYRHYRLELEELIRRGK
ncbi:MAG: hypothetical protein CMJ49_03250 [Planctomycetaceae bacterium]|nr:hypothetical protein [Planctomycetaceae bacterium]